MPLIGRASARVRLFLVLSGLLGCVSARPAFAQSLVSGSLTGDVLGTDNTYVSAALVTITNRATGNAWTIVADRRGRFNFALVIPGTYSVLSEQAGFQPVRHNGIVVRPGEETRLPIRLERRPPPIDAVIDLPEPPLSTLSSRRAVGQEISGEELQYFDRRHDVTDVSRDLSMVVAPSDGRSGYAIATEGLPQIYSRFFVDGIQEFFLRHPGIQGEPAATPLFPRNSIAE
ncbi:MAG: carboxypeptidase-like regulatory domain-containing protein, partial [Gemmatimonadota bacterium]